MQQEFIRQYLADPRRDAKRAAIAAGYSVPCAAAHACRMLKSIPIRQAIEEREASYRRKLDAQAEKAYIDERMVVAGILKEIADAKASGQGAWQSATILRAYELLGKYLGMFKDQVEIGLDAAIISQLEQGRRRAAGLIEPEEEEEEKKDGADKPN
jgi:hypothetical protein